MGAQGQMPGGWVPGRPDFWVSFPWCREPQRALEKRSGQSRAVLSEGIWGVGEQGGPEGELLQPVSLQGSPPTQCFVL